MVKRHYKELYSKAFFLLILIGIIAILAGWAYRKYQ